ncbi:MAG: Holliday junction branch migration protein RuvA [Betaproteobacteria bacterium]|nr:Holliday junction branch migration protein RuvA [Betaproteobacteria bacterium]
MICRLRGIVLEREPPAAVIETAGIGYAVWLPTKDFASLPAAGDEAIVHTVQLTRDDAPIMYGFTNESERRAFLALLKISGIGAKSALGLLSTMDLASLAGAIMRSDAKALGKAPGIGPKAAARIILEMRDNPDLAAAPAEVPVFARATESLIALGYSAAAARKALAALPTKDYQLSELIKAALRQLSN